MLSQASLAASLLDIFASKDSIRTAQEYEERWASAYDAYARQAQDVSGELPITVNGTGFRRALNFEASGSAAALAAQFEAAFQVYWTGAIFSFGIPPPPVPPGCPNVGGTSIFSTELSSLVIEVVPSVMQAQLVTQFSVASREESIESRAQAIASAIHMATTTAVFVLITGLDTTSPPTGPLPVTNTCRVT